MRKADSPSAPMRRRVLENPKRDAFASVCGDSIRSILLALSLHEVFCTLPASAHHRASPGDYGSFLALGKPLWKSAPVILRVKRVRWHLDATKGALQVFFVKNSVTLNADATADFGRVPFFRPLARHSLCHLPIP